MDVIYMFDNSSSSFKTSDVSDSHVTSVHVNNIVISSPGSQTADDLQTVDDIDAIVFNVLDIFFNCFLIHVLSLLGVVANVLNIVVLSRHGMQESTNILLMSLSVSDLCSSFVQPFRRLKCLVSQFDVPSSITIRAFTFVYIYPITDFFEAISICHVTAISIERFVAVCFPLRVSRVFTPSRVCWLVVCLYGYTLGMYLPIVFRLTYAETYDVTFNVTVGLVAISQFYQENYGPLNIYSNFYLNNAFTTLTLLIILFCSVVITVQLTSRRTKLLKVNSEQTSSNKRAQERKVAKMLLTVCLVTLSAYLPTAVIYMCLLYANITVLSSDNLYFLLETIIGNLYQFVASVNFLIYVTMSSKFARTYTQLFS
ncbi:FMRFamide receptor-like [Physella acuta]|uniref:FMRFamide receptor-like n=1 Tax=Physella acuta TaxID=109671 RepID=UPI0027DBDF9F|nr:FMRFamide receptor-like [Physella acuta]